MITTNWKRNHVCFE